MINPKQLQSRGKKLIILYLLIYTRILWVKHTQTLQEKWLSEAEKEAIGFINERKNEALRARRSIYHDVYAFWKMSFKLQDAILYSEFWSGYNVTVYYRHPLISLIVLYFDVAHVDAYSIHQIYRQILNNNNSI